MVTINKSDLAVFDSLSVVRLNGFEPKTERVYLSDGTVVEDGAGIDWPGSANWLVLEYGLQPDGEFSPDRPGILWTDYDCGGWKFSVLIASDKVEDFRKLAEGAGYEVLKVTEITEPANYGDGAGVVTIMKHPDGWCLAS